MNWGKGIVIGLGAFMGFVVFLVVLMFKAPDDSYDKDYYEKGLSYDNEYNRRQNVLNDNVKPVVALEGEYIRIYFKELESGELILYRPSNNKLDKKMKVKNEQVEIPVSDLVKGDWKLIAEWTANGKSYLYEQNIFIP